MKLLLFVVVVWMKYFLLENWKLFKIENFLDVDYIAPVPRPGIESDTFELQISDFLTQLHKLQNEDMSGLMKNLYAP